MIIKQLEFGPMGNFVYLLADESIKSCAVIDPGWEAEKIIKIAEKEGLKITHILLTHTHFDHAGAANTLSQKSGAIIFVHMLEGTEGKNTKVFNNNEIIRIGQLVVKCLHTPGHTPGSTCFVVDNVIFTGDTLFVDGIGRTDLEGGDPEQMFNSLKLLKHLPDNMIIYAGHNYGGEAVSTINDQKKRNPYLRAENVGDFLRY